MFVITKSVKLSSFAQTIDRKRLGCRVYRTKPRLCIWSRWTMPKKA